MTDLDVPVIGVGTGPRRLQDMGTAVLFALLTANTTLNNLACRATTAHASAKLQGNVLLELLTALPKTPFKQLLQQAHRVSPVKRTPAFAPHSIPMLTAEAEAAQVILEVISPMGLDVPVSGGSIINQLPLTVSNLLVIVLLEILA